MEGPREREEVEEFDREYNPSIFTRGLDVLVPEALARWALRVSIETDGDVYESGDPVPFEVTIENRLPVPIDVRIDGRRVWSWSIDGHVEGTDERIYTPETARTLSLRAGETRRFERTWNGRIKRNGSPARWTELPKGEYELAAFVPTEPPTRDETTVTLR